ncbi:locomotion-related protein Hikaru genki isoform X2 [Euwallacea fornicatus]|uniref:locomotion-related protein Hikaru genki isoform X2 n=1 Tax=Euwallacea fornicatus TaxID=995702 RepID=UPI00338E5141
MGHIFRLILLLTAYAASGKDLQEDLTSDSCLPPHFALNGTHTDKGEMKIRKEYSHVREVKFSGSIGPLGEKRLCKIKCIGGQWVGPLCANEQDNGKFQPLFKNCKLEYIGKHLLVTFKNITIHNPGIAFPHGSQLQVRCKEMGLYKLVGPTSPKCHNGEWTTRLPSCVPTSLLRNFTDDSPPTILVKIPSGSASVEPGGELAVFPGSTLHFECLCPRRTGSPDWTWTTPLGQYLTGKIYLVFRQFSRIFTSSLGWAMAPEDRDWKYRLSIYYAKPQDSGTFTCASPRGTTNSIILHVASITCEPIKVSGQHLTVRVEGTRLGHSATFQCPLGYYVSGSPNLTCQASGKWSYPVPKCAPIKCPPLNSPAALPEPHLQLEEHNNSVDGRAVFSCAWGYKMTGSPAIECLMSGNWSGKFPKCVPVQCPPPLLPINGHLIQSESPGMDGGRYAVGSLVQFACKGAHLLEGEASIICTEMGFWSHPPPFCKPRCPYMGNPENGTVAPIKFAYEPGDILQITCNPGFELKMDEERLKCLSDGKWNAALPNCTSYDQI